MIGQKCGYSVRAEYNTRADMIAYPASLEQSPSSCFNWWAV
jgi:hypothetical protein